MWTIQKDTEMGMMDSHSFIDFQKRYVNWIWHDMIAYSCRLHRFLHWIMKYKSTMNDTNKRH